MTTIEKNEILFFVFVGVPVGCPVACPILYEPLCGSNNETYDNKCLFETAVRCKKLRITIRHEGACLGKNKQCVYFI